MKCCYCGGELRRGSTTFTESRAGYVIVLNDVSAWICSQCGEPLLDEESVRGIQDMLHEMDKSVRKLHRAA